MEALLPAWIIGSVFVVAVIDWMRTPRVTRDDRTTYVARPTVTA